MAAPNIHPLTLSLSKGARASFDKLRTSGVGNG
jgi:hypothetical protein